MSGPILALPDLPPLQDPRVRAAINELAGLILEAFPEAALRVTGGEEPGTIFLHATVDLDDPEPVLDLVIDRMMDLLVEEGIPLYVIPRRAAARAAASRRATEGRLPVAAIT